SHQPEDRQDAWSHHSALATRPRRRGDRVAIPIAALHECAYGPKRTSASALHMSAFGRNAGIVNSRCCEADVQVVPIRINPKENGRVNRYNLLKLAGAGHAIASTLEHAIECLLQGDTKKRVIDLNLSIEITVYPQNALRDQEGARLIRMDVLSSLKANERNKSRLVTSDPNIFQLAPDGRP